MWRKSCGLLLAIVWEATLVDIINKLNLIDFNDITNDIINNNYTANTIIKISMFLIVTILFTYCGIKFIDIKRSCIGYSNTDITKNFIKQYQRDVQRIQFEANQKLKWM